MLLHKSGSVSDHGSRSFIYDSTGSSWWISISLYGNDTEYYEEYWCISELL